MRMHVQKYVHAYSSMCSILNIEAAKNYILIESTKHKTKKTHEKP